MGRVLAVAAADPRDERGAGKIAPIRANPSFGGATRDPRAATLSRHGRGRTTDPRGPARQREVVRAPLPARLLLLPLAARQARGRRGRGSDDLPERAPRARKGNDSDHGGLLVARDREQRVPRPLAIAEDPTAGAGGGARGIGRGRSPGARPRARRAAQRRAGEASGGPAPRVRPA